MTLSRAWMRSIGIGLTASMAACHGAPPRPSAASDSPSGTVAYTALVPKPSEQYRLQHSEHAFGAQPVDHAAPAYPPALIDRHLPDRVVRVKAIVDASGRVSEVRDLDPSAGPDHGPFFEACREAVRQWTFTPMTFVDETDDGKGHISQQRKTAPFSIDYAFHFTVVDGHAGVAETH